MDNFVSDRLCHIWKRELSKEVARVKRACGAGGRESLKNPCYSIYNSAIRSGKLVRPDACSDCGKKCVPHGHHHDYSLPLTVTWLCPMCHINWHKTHGKALFY